MTAVRSPPTSHHLPSPETNIQNKGTNVSAGYWSSIEANCSIICASIPTLKPLISRIFPNLLGNVRVITQSETNSHGSRRSRRVALTQSAQIRSASNELRADFALDTLGERLAREWKFEDLEAGRSEVSAGSTGGMNGTSEGKIEVTTHIEQKSEKAVDVEERERERDRESREGEVECGKSETYPYVLM